MVARVARFEGVNVQEVERTMAEAEARIRSIVDGLAGFRGYLDLLSAEGEVLAIALFDTLEDAEAAEATFDIEMPQKLGDLFEGWSGRRVSVGRYTVLAESRT
jgi:hypothetical protein